MNAAGRQLVVAMAAVAVLGVGAAMPGVWVRATYGAQLSADEPHYLLTAISLVEDGDLDLVDEFAAERYRPFHEVRLSPQGSALDDERIVAPHDPLLPALLAVPWRVGGWQGAKIALVLVNGLLGALLVWTAVRRFSLPTGVAAVVAGVFVASAPLAVYGSQLYPELPAAFVVLAAVAAGIGPPRGRTAAVVGVAVVALPWLAVKYVPVAATLAVVILLRWWRAGARRLVHGSLAAFGVAGVAYAVGHLAWYGGLTPYAASDFFLERGGQLSVIGTGPDHLGRSRRLIGLLVDRDFGLAAWQPAYLLAIPAVAAIVRRRPDGWLALVAPLAIGWLGATFLALTMQGWWFPGRQVVVVLPLAVVAVAWLAGRGRAWLRATVVTGAFGILAWAWLLADGLRERVTLIVDFAANSNPVQRGWRMLLPDYLQVTTSTWVLHGSWLVAAILLGWLAWRGARGSGRGVGGAA